VRVSGKNGFAAASVSMKDQKALKCIPIARLTFAVGLIFQQTHLFLSFRGRLCAIDRILNFLAGPGVCLHLALGGGLT